MLAAVLMLHTISYAADREAGSGFEDVAASSWYSQAIDWAIPEGIASGTGNRRFSPDAVCSRAALHENPEPQMGQESDPLYLVKIEYSENREDMFYSVETGASVLYKPTGTFGPGGAGYIAVKSEELQPFLDAL